MMNVLVIGSNGNISFNFVNLALAMGWSVTTISRGYETYARRRFDHSNRVDHYFDVNSGSSLSHFMAGRCFDAVVDFVCFDAIEAEKRVDSLAGRVGSYIFVSTTASYSKDPIFLPYTELTPVDSVAWGYCRRKVEAENVFIGARMQTGFPVVIARLAHTYDTVIPVAVGPSDWTIPQRIRSGKPVVVHGDGRTIWTLTHAHDVSIAMLGLCENTNSIGEIFNVVSDARLTWVDVTLSLFSALDRESRICYVPSRVINDVSPSLGGGIVGHKMWNDYYDNRKIVQFLGGWKPRLSLADGLRRSVEWYGSDVQRQLVSAEFDSLLDGLCEMANGTYDA